MVANISGSYCIQNFEALLLSNKLVPGTTIGIKNVLLLSLNVYKKVYTCARKLNYM